MRIAYNRETDTLTITLRDTAIEESDEVGPGVIADFAADGSIVRFETLQASQVMSDTEHVTFERTA